MDTRNLRKAILGDEEFFRSEQHGSTGRDGGFIMIAHCLVEGQWAQVP